MENKMTNQTNIQFTDEQRVAILYAKVNECNWIVKDIEGDVLAFRKKPVSSYGFWLPDKSDTAPETISTDFPFLSWQDNEPFFIGNLCWRIVNPELSNTV